MTAYLTPPKKYTFTRIVIALCIALALLVAGKSWLKEWRTPVQTYAHRLQPDINIAMQKGYLPAWLPHDAQQISSAHQRDQLAIWARFESASLTRIMGRLPLTPVTDVHLPQYIPSHLTWFTPRLQGAQLYRSQALTGDMREYLLIETADSSNIAYYWIE